MNALPTRTDEQTPDVRTRAAVEIVWRALLSLVDACEIYLDKKRTSEIRREWKDLKR